MLSTVGMLGHKMFQRFRAWPPLAAIATMRERTDQQPFNGADLLQGAGASAGFLLWNWRPAKIFMGDVGSGFLGFVLVVMLSVIEHVYSDGPGPL